MYHIINLSLNCKTATGDGTKIVCMNSDYVVRITAKDCGTFTDLPVKKLVIRHDREYQEVDIVQIVEDYNTYLQAVLPPISYKDYVDLGVCGKTEGGIPSYTSTSARFVCEQSVLNGIVVELSAPTLMELDVNTNGTYVAGEHAADGFSKVNVNVAGSDTEARTASLAMANGDQIIEPSRTGISMRSVKVMKPATLVPNNIVKGVNIGGVVGTYENVFDEIRISDDGEYTPPDGVDGFSKVIVNVAKNSRERTMRVGHSFTYDYNASATVEFDNPGIVSASDNGESITITALKLGDCLVTVKDYDSSGNLLDTVYYAVSVTADGDATLPIEVNSGAEMVKYLTKERIGGVLKYTGDTTSEFLKNSLYLIEEG